MQLVYLPRRTIEVMLRASPVGNATYPHRELNQLYYFTVKNRKKPCQITLTSYQFSLYNLKLKVLVESLGYISGSTSVGSGLLEACMHMEAQRGAKGTLYFFIFRTYTYGNKELFLIFNMHYHYRMAVAELKPLV